MFFFLTVNMATGQIDISNFNDVQLLLSVSDAFFKVSLQITIAPMTTRIFLVSMISWNFLSDVVLFYFLFTFKSKLF